MDGTSNILDGSSSNNKSGSQNKALARDNLILQPPENALEGSCWLSLVKPRPYKMEAALLSALSESISMSFSLTSCKCFSKSPLSLSSLVCSLEPSSNSGLSFSISSILSYG